MVPFALIILFLVASLQPTLSSAYSWHFTTPPTQCSNLSISIVGSDGQPPYRVFIMPSGASPLANNVDVRAMIDQPFDGNSTTISFPINYPANSHFIAVLSDANDFGTGGVSVETLVGDSNDDSCFNPNKTWSPLFYYGVGADNQITQCQPTRVWWNASNSQGPTSFYGVVPGGQCFELEGANHPDVQDQETGFAWTPNIRGGTTVIIMGGDSRGMGTGGCAQFTVQPGSNATCLDNTSPSSTPGVAAGALQTNPATSGTNSSAANDGGGGGPNVGVIVGAAVGGIIGLLILIAFIVVSYYCLRQDGRRTRRLHRRAPAVATTGHISSPASRQLSVPGQGTSIATNPDEHLARYQPEPFSFTGVGTQAYNNGYPYGGQGYAGGMAPGTASAVPPRGRLDSVTSGSGPGMSDTSSQAGSRHRWPPSQGASGPGMSDTSSQAGSRYGFPPSQGASGHGMSDTSSQAGSRYGWPPSQGPNPGLHQQTSGLLSVKSGLGLYDASNQTGGAPSVISNTSGPPYTRGGPSGLPYENTVSSGPPRGPTASHYENTVPGGPPPAFTPSNMSRNPPTGDVKYQIRNPG